MSNVETPNNHQDPLPHRSKLKESDDKHEQKKERAKVRRRQWGWFILLWVCGFGAALTLGGAVKLIVHLSK